MTSTRGPLAVPGGGGYLQGAGGGGPLPHKHQGHCCGLQPGRGDHLLWGARRYQVLT